ncbi:hypothetical protein ASG43_08945 [Aureimonas sp. Leaf454]|uniref:acyltransferase family protein n=1 Tax=Aureimonas sp. Leaf454 TaxID=1736381 RepID=UPI0006FEA687|nr:acyltransferase [Aureimonas sp. Leaf454]KQT48950.1 hypothetical protein ASG43_08945 [Aureimonas sp. Leaf454]
MNQHTDVASNRPILAGPERRNLNVQWLRAAAALFVVLYHASHYLSATFGDDRFIRIFDGKFGLLGVAIFFAITGALMADLFRRTEPTLFLAHRLVRIYPLYILVYLVVTTLRRGEPHFDIRAVSLALVGSRAQFELGIEWTLIIEIFFYVVLFILAVMRGARWLEAFALVWLAAIGVAVLVEPAQMAQTLLPTVLQVFFLPGNAAFAGGLLIPAILKRGGFPPALAAVAFGFGAVSMSVDLAYGRLLGAVAAVIIVGAAFGHVPSRGEPTRIERGFAKLGDWSYALYLCHVPMIWLVYAHLEGSTPFLWLAAVSSAVLISIPVGMLDVALYRRLRAATNRSTMAVRARLIGAYLIAYAVVAVLFVFKQG